MGKRKSKPKKKKTSVQKKAAERHKKFKQTRVQTFGGKKTSFSKSEQKRIKDAGYSVKGYSKAPAKSTPKSIAKGTTGIGPVKSGATYSKAVSTAKNQPTKKTTGIGPFASGAEYAAKLKASPPKNYDFGPAPKPAISQVTMMDETGQRYGGKVVDGVPQFKTPDGKTPTLRGYTPTMPGLAKSLGISTEGANMGSVVGDTITKIKSPTTYGYPSQAEVDKAAGITAGGLNIGGGGFTPSKPSGANVRAIADYKSTLDPDSYKGLSDGETRGSGPVISGDDYARGLNVDNKNVENIGRSILSRIPGVNIRRLTDKEIADNRVSAQNKLAYRKEMAQFRGGGGGGGLRLPVGVLTPEEILLPVETARAQTGPDYQQAQTGVDPNRLMQIQQEAYLQAFNPSYNPMFRFFGRRGMGRGSFRKAFRRKD